MLNKISKQKAFPNLMFSFAATSHITLSCDIWSTIKTTPHQNIKNIPCSDNYDHLQKWLSPSLQSSLSTLTTPSPITGTSDYLRSIYLVAGCIATPVVEILLISNAIPPIRNLAAVALIEYMFIDYLIGFCTTKSALTAKKEATHVQLRCLHGPDYQYNEPDYYGAALCLSSNYPQNTSHKPIDIYTCSNYFSEFELAGAYKLLETCDLPMVCYLPSDIKNYLGSIAHSELFAIEEIINS
jgi:hypothetical protein